jgi:dihydropteroate synthase
MGIINVTPDSFSGDGLLDEENVKNAAVEKAAVFINEGVDILDVGGESTRPGAEFVGEEEEINRVVPVIKAIRANFPHVLISVDTYKAKVAREAIPAGGDSEMGAVAAEYQVPVILMHNRLQPGSSEIEERLGGRYIGTDYDDLIKDIRDELMTGVSLAHQNGIVDENIILDPGIGFGKTVPQNLELMDRLDEIKSLGYPLLVGPSRKSFIGYTLDLPPEDRLEGTAAAVALAIDRGADIIRIHDVKVMTRVARMTDAIVRR